MEESFGSVWQVTHRARRRPKEILDVALCLLGILTNCTSVYTTPTPTPQRSSLPQNPLTTPQTWHRHCLSRLWAPSSPSQRASPTAQSMPGWG